MSDWHKKNVTELSDALRQGNVTSTALTEHFLARIEKHDPLLNCYIQVCPELALAQAAEADKKISQGQGGVLTGIPFAHKDIFCTDGVRTTAGSKMLENFVPPYNATVTQRLFDAGMVMLGKANMDEFAMGSSTEHSFFGACRNPFDTDYVPGGSSGGSSSAVAAGLAPIATGTDTGGSIRQPASYCHLVGIKPTYGQVSRYGMIAFASSLDQGGVLAQSVTDAALMLETMVGPDPMDSTTHEATPGASYSKNIEHAAAQYKIAVPKAFVDAMDEEGQSEFHRVLDMIRKNGHQIDFIDLNIASIVIPTYYVIAPAEASSNLARYDGVRYGHRSADAKTIEELYVKSRSEGFGYEVKRRILMGTYVLSSGYYEAFYHQATRIRAILRKRFAEIFEKYDFVATPSALSSAFKLNALDHDPIAMYFSDLCTVSVNLANLPAISLPLMRHKGLPLGFQLIAPHFEEARLFQFSYQLEKMSPWGHIISPIKNS